LAGVKLKTLDYWVRTGLVTPSIRATPGRRRSRLWSVQDAVFVRAVKALRDGGCPLQTIRKAQTLLEQRWKQTLRDVVLFWDGKDLLGLGPWGRWSSLVQSPGQQVLHVVALPLQHWRRETESVMQLAAATRREQAVAYGDRVARSQGGRSK
jgi:DNA-binding transcriptional MerR regulator